MENMQYTSIPAGIPIMELKRYVKVIFLSVHTLDRYHAIYQPHGDISPAKWMKNINKINILTNFNFL